MFDVFDSNYPQMEFYEISMDCNLDDRNVFSIAHWFPDGIINGCNFDFIVLSLLPIAILAALAMPFLEPDTLSSSSGIDSSVSSRFISTDNTRVDVWNALLRGFMQNPLFGIPLQGDRMGYGENSWLSAGANLGLIGFIPMMMAGWESSKLIWQLNRLGNRNPHYFFQSSAVIAGLGSMLVGSCFEAFLLGNITFSLLAFLTYLLMGAYLIEVDRFRTYYAMNATYVADDAGVYQ
jgi:hypothetical protein